MVLLLHTICAMQTVSLHKLPVKKDLALSMDRTNWKFVKFNINILMLGITYKGIALPLIFTMPKRGNSNWE